MISIIVATFNSEQTLPRCLASLREQQGAEFQLLVADGGSTDGTLRLLDQNRDLAAWQTSGPDRGVYDAWNKALAHAEGEWILFLGSDDWIDAADTLARLAGHLDKVTPDQRRNCFIFGRTVLMDEGREIELLGQDALPGDRFDPDAAVGFSHTGLVHHRSLFETLGPYDARFRSAGDYEFMLRASLDPEVRFRHVPLTVARMASGGMSNGAASRLRHYTEAHHARMMHGFTATPAWLRGARLRAACLHLLDRHLGPAAALFAANAYRRLRGKAARGTI